MLLPRPQKSFDAKNVIDFFFKSVFNVMLAYGFYQRAIPHLNITHLRRHKCGYLSDT